MHIRENRGSNSVNDCVGIHVVGKGSWKEREVWNFETKLEYFWLLNPYWQISGAWALSIYGKLAQPKLMGTCSVLFKLGYELDRFLENSSKIEHLVEKRYSRNFGVWNRPIMVEFSRNRSSSWWVLPDLPIRVYTAFKTFLLRFEHSNFKLSNLKLSNFVFLPSGLSNYMYLAVCLWIPF